MSNFFDNIKDIKNNPFAKKKVVQVDGAATPDPTTESVEEKLERIKKNGTAQERVNSIAEAVATLAASKEKPRKRINVDAMFASMKKEAAVKEEAEAAKEEPVAAVEEKEIPAADTPVEEVQEEPTEHPKEEVEVKPEPEETAEEKPKKRTRRTKAKAETTTGSGTEVTTNKFVYNYDVLGEKVSYDEMLEINRDYLQDSSWQDIEDEINSRLSDMVIAPDMNSASLLELLANIDVLNTDIQMQLRRDRQFYDTLTNKDFGIAMAIKLQNCVGSNDQERRRNGFMALKQVPVGDKKVDYLYAINAAAMRLSFLENVSRQLDYKRQMCITVAANLKIENSLSATHV